jgi:hypothetical protein
MSAVVYMATAPSGVRYVGVTLRAAISIGSGKSILLKRAH